MTGMSLDIPEAHAYVAPHLTYTVPDKILNASL